MYIWYKVRQFLRRDAVLGSGATPTDRRRAQSRVVSLTIPYYSLFYYYFFCHPRPEKRSFAPSISDAKQNSKTPPLSQRGHRHQTFHPSPRSQLYLPLRTRVSCPLGTGSPLFAVCSWNCCTLSKKGPSNLNHTHATPPPPPTAT